MTKSDETSGLCLVYHLKLLIWNVISSSYQTTTLFSHTFILCTKSIRFKVDFCTKYGLFFGDKIPLAHKVHKYPESVEWRKISLHKSCLYNLRNLNVHTILDDSPLKVKWLHPLAFSILAEKILKRRVRVVKDDKMRLSDRLEFFTVHNQHFSFFFQNTKRVLSWLLPPFM